MSKLYSFPTIQRNAYSKIGLPVGMDSDDYCVAEGTLPAVPWYAEPGCYTADLPKSGEVKLDRAVQFLKKEIRRARKGERTPLSLEQMEAELAQHNGQKRGDELRNERIRLNEQVQDFRALKDEVSWKLGRVVRTPDVEREARKIGLKPKYFDKDSKKNRQSEKRRAKKRRAKRKQQTTLHTTISLPSLRR
jgi:hypothetical protein